MVLHMDAQVDSAPPSPCKGLQRSAKRSRAPLGRHSRAADSTEPSFVFIITVMPKIVDREAQRRQIAAAAVRVVGETGFEGARLRDIARAAGVTTGAVAHYFEGKEAVLEAALEGMVGHLLEQLDTLRAAPTEVDPSGATRAQRAGFARRYLSYLPTHPARRAEWRVWVAYWGRAVARDSAVAERLRRIHQRHYAALVDRLADALSTLRPVGAAASSTECRRCADACIAAIDGVGTRATLEPDAWPAERQRRTLRRLLEPLLADFVARPATG